ncbi:hypothetical protein LINPERPRIM_LOCUS3828 [Linum perenne]
MGMDVGHWTAAIVLGFREEDRVGACDGGDVDMSRRRRFGSLVEKREALQICFIGGEEGVLTTAVGFGFGEEDRVGVMAAMWICVGGEETHTSNPNEIKVVGANEKQDDRDAAIWIGVCRGFVDEKQVGVWREKISKWRLSVDWRSSSISQLSSVHHPDILFSLFLSSLRIDSYFLEVNSKPDSLIRPPPTPLSNSRRRPISPTPAADPLSNSRRRPISPTPAADPLSNSRRRPTLQLPPPTLSPTPAADPSLQLLPPTLSPTPAADPSLQLPPPTLSPAPIQILPFAVPNLHSNSRRRWGAIAVIVARVRSLGLDPGPSPSPTPGGDLAVDGGGVRRPPPDAGED